VVREPSNGPDDISLPDHKSVVCVGRLNESEDRSNCGDDIFLKANTLRYSAIAGTGRTFLPQAHGNGQRSLVSARDLAFARVMDI